jgi:hypothetical protein
MASSTPKTVLLKGDPLFKEALTGGTITPGNLVQINSSGVLVRHANAGQNAIPLFSFENENVGSGIDSVYSTGNRARYFAARPGDEVWAVLASGQNVNAGAFLESAGDGTLRAYTNQSGQNVYTAAVVGVAKEAKNNSAGDASGPPAVTAGATRIRLEVR